MNQHQKMVHTIKEFIKDQEGYNCAKSGSMPLGCTSETRLYLPDIVVLRDLNITHIIETESSTGGTTICGKIVLADRCTEIMVNVGQQSSKVKPKLIFLYKQSFPENNLKRVKYRVKEASIKIKYIDEPIIDYFPANWSWL